MNTKHPIDDDPQWTAWLLGELDEPQNEHWRAAVDAHPQIQEQEQAQRVWLGQFSQLMALPTDVTLHEVHRQKIRQSAKAACVAPHRAEMERMPFGHGWWQRWAATGLAALLVLTLGLLWREMRGTGGANLLSNIPAQSQPDVDFSPAAQAAATNLAPLRSNDADVSNLSSVSEARTADWRGVPATVALPWTKDVGAWGLLEKKLIVAAEPSSLAAFLPSPQHAAALLNDFSFARNAQIGVEDAWQGLRVRTELMRGESGRQWLALGVCNASERGIVVAAELQLADSIVPSVWQWRGCGWSDRLGAPAASPVRAVESKQPHTLMLQPGEQATLLLELQRHEAASDLGQRDALGLVLSLRAAGQQRLWQIKGGDAVETIADFAHSSPEMQHLVLVWRFAEWMRLNGTRQAARSWMTDCEFMQRVDDNAERRRARVVMLRALTRAGD